MSTDYAAKERSFIGLLAEETGRDLQSWMAAIDGCGHNERNAIIDWLRLQGFQFSRASWLERIHHNGGRLIYADDIQPTVEPKRAAVESADIDGAPLKPAVTVEAPIAQAASKNIDSGLERLLASAKGLRPLAEAVIAEVRNTAGGGEIEADARLIMITAAGFPVAALLPGAKQIRLYADFGRRSAPRVVKAEPVGKVPPPFPDMIVMNDARSIDAEFRACLRSAFEPPISKTA